MDKIYLFIFIHIKKLSYNHFNNKLKRSCEIKEKNGKSQIRTDPLFNLH